MNIDIVTITPSMAKKLLERNPTNRPIKAHHVAEIARDMLKGDWQVNGDTIRLDKDGMLIDGQHRLSACVLSGVSFVSVVVSGLPPNVRETIDGGSKRSFGDRLSMSGVTNAKAVAAATRAIAGFATGELSHIRLSHSELARIFEMHPDISTSVHISNHSFPNIGTLLSALHYIAWNVSGLQIADDFINVWKTGIPHYDGDPVHLLRERIVKTAGSTNSIRRPDLHMLSASALVRFMSGSKVRVLKTGDTVSIPGWDRSRVGL